MITLPDTPLPKEVIELCKKTFETHIGMEGITGKGFQPEYRKTECRYIQRAKRVGAPQPRAIQLVEEWINEQGYPYTPEILQIARYHKGNFYKWHTDSDNASKGSRKLSLSCLLNHPSEFEGGEFEIKFKDQVSKDGTIVMAGQKTEIKLKQYQAVLFPPDLMHRVLPVWEGVRDSLVIWFMEK
jgi:Rps23 Pro-64 3,4-dihydroxylase Tpa1-like proline 4-hydroxylase